MIEAATVFHGFGPQVVNVCGQSNFKHRLGADRFRVLLAHPASNCRCCIEVHRPKTARQLKHCFSGGARANENIVFVRREATLRIEIFKNSGKACDSISP